MVVVKCKMLEINQIIIFKEPFFKEYLTYFQPTITLHYQYSLKWYISSVYCVKQNENTEAKGDRKKKWMTAGVRS